MKKVKKRNIIVSTRDGQKLVVWFEDSDGVWVLSEHPRGRLMDSSQSLDQLLYGVFRRLDSGDFVLYVGRHG